MATALFLVALLSSLVRSASAQTQCTLTDSQKFDPSCEDIVSDQPSVVFRGVEFNLNFHPPIFNGTLYITSTNASIFASTNDFCGPNSFSDGVVCSNVAVVVINGLQNLRLRLICDGVQQTQLNSGPAVLILGFPAPYTCSVQLNTTWGQSK